MEQKQKIVEILIAAADEFTSSAADKILKAANGEITAENVETFDTIEKRALFYAERLIENGAILLSENTDIMTKSEADIAFEQYAKGYYDGMSDYVEKLKEKYGQQDTFIPRKIITVSGLQLNNLLKEMAGEN